MKYFKLISNFIKICFDKIPKKSRFALAIEIIFAITIVKLVNSSHTKLAALAIIMTSIVTLAVYIMPNINKK